MSHSRRRSTSILLTSLLLLAQLLLAWHLPSHIGSNDHVVATDSQTDSTALSHISGEPCALGINGHGAALPASASYAALTPSAALSYRTVLIHYHSLAYTSYQARGPPLHS
ncbi:MAG: hypothetical protein KAG82_14205 [Alcanivoracaceae bacterium]|jgi:hypothetical protein|nr:hypothetical protein [Alcanivoracaceae bacterium]